MFVDKSAVRGKSGIYRIYRIVGDYEECWVGQAKNIAARWSTHENRFADGTNSPILQRAWNKYGSDAFGWEVLEFVADLDDLTPREQYYFDTIKPVYNVARIAASRLGCHHSSLGRLSAQSRYIQITHWRKMSEINLLPLIRFLSPSLSLSSLPRACQRRRRAPVRRMERPALEMPGCFR